MQHFEGNENWWEAHPHIYTQYKSTHIQKLDRKLEIDGNTIMGFNIHSMNEQIFETKNQLDNSDANW